MWRCSTVSRCVSSQSSNRAARDALNNALCANGMLRPKPLCVSDCVLVAQTSRLLGRQTSSVGLIDQRCEDTVKCKLRKLQTDVHAAYIRKFDTPDSIERPVCVFLHLSYPWIIPCCYDSYCIRVRRTCIADTNTCCSTIPRFVNGLCYGSTIFDCIIFLRWSMRLESYSFQRILCLLAGR